MSVAAHLDVAAIVPYIPIGMESDIGQLDMPQTGAAPRGRPRQFCADAALTAALRVFWSKGYEGASMADLTEAMGITKPSLYACFGNKEALFCKALDLYERDKLAYVNTGLQAPTAKAVAEHFLRGAVALQTQAGDPHCCLGVISVVSCITFAESIRDEVMARRASSDLAIVERFRRAQAEGDLPEGTTPEALAMYLSAILQGVSVQAGAGATRAQLDQLVDTTLAMWPGR